jgi:phosphate transport system substrate-binding protein
MTKKTLIAGAVAIVLALGAAACGGGSGGTTTAARQTTTPASAGGETTTLVGAGSSFVYPLVTNWMKDYREKAGVTVTYGPIGSGGGIAAITGNTVDFGASDAPLSPDQLAACSSCVQIPWALAGTSVTYNVPGAPAHLKLDGPAIAALFLGAITHWDDPRIAKLNPGAKLPDLKVTPVFRSDSSGTTYNFTEYLSAVSPTWRQEVGHATQVSFPTGVGGKGSSGVTGIVSRTPGAVTYVDAAYAIENSLAYARVQNRSGEWTLPTTDAVAAAAKAVTRIPADLAISVVDPPAAAKGAYPISTFTYAIVHADSPKAPALARFLGYAIGDGQRFAADLQFAPLPAQVVAADRKALAELGT